MVWVIDFEASSLSEKSYPIEVGVTNGQVDYSALIRPLPQWTDWSSESADIHHISRNQLAEYGIRADIVAHELNELLAGETIYCDSATWDGFWANVLYSDNGLMQRFDIRDITELLPKDSKVASKYLSHKQFIVLTGEYTEHRALDDAKIIWNYLDVALNE